MHSSAYNVLHGCIVVLLQCSAPRWTCQHPTNSPHAVLHTKTSSFRDDALRHSSIHGFIQHSPASRAATRSGPPFYFSTSTLPNTSGSSALTYAGE